MQSDDVEDASLIELISTFRKSARSSRRLVNVHAARGESVQESKAWGRHNALMHEILETLKARGYPTLGESLWVEHEILLVGLDLMTPGQRKSLTAARRVIRAKLVEEARRIVDRAHEERARLDLVQKEYEAIIGIHNGSVSLVQEEAFKDTAAMLGVAVRQGRLTPYSVPWMQGFVSTYTDSLRSRRGEHSRILDRRISERMVEIAAERGIRVHTRVAHASGSKYGFVKKLFLGPAAWGILSPSNIMAEVSWDHGWKEHVNLFSLVLPQDLPPAPVFVFDVEASGEDDFSWQSEEDDVATAGRVLYKLMDEYPGEVKVVITRRQKE